MWPSILLWLSRRPRLMTPALLMLGVASLLLSGVLAVRNPSAGFYLLPTRFWELLAGGALAMYGARLGNRATERVSSVRDTALSWGGALLFVLTFVFINRRTPSPGLWALLPVLGTVALIAAGPATMLNRAVLGNRVAVWIGLISYPLYLWHWPLLSFFRIASLDTGISVNTVYIVKVCLAVLAVVLAYATYRWVEQPTRRASRRVAANPASRMHGIGLYLVPLAFVGTLALVTAAFEGLPFRHDSAGSASAEVMRPDGWRIALQAYRSRSVHCTGDAARLDWCWASHAADAPVAASDGAQIAVFGDSHAEVFYPGLVDAMPDRSILLIGQSGCGPFAEVAFHNVIAPDECVAANRIALAYLVAARSVHTVLLAGRGPLYISGVGFGKTEASQQWTIAPAHGGTTGDAEAVYHDGMARTIDALTKAGKRVVFVLDVPELAFSPESCVLARPLGLRPLQTPCGVSRDAFDRRSARYREVVAQLATQFPTMQLSDASTVFCRQAFCDAMRDGQLLYADSNHLSLGGSRLLGRSLARVLRAEPAITLSP